MKILHVFFDHRCGMCGRFRRWLEGQAQLVEIQFTSYHDPAAKQICPILDSLHPEEKLVVMADTGQVYQGETAWIMCLWALDNYRELSMTLARPRWLPLARRVCELVSTNRYVWSKLLFAKPNQLLLAEIEANPAAAPCENEYCPL